MILREAQKTQEWHVWRPFCTLTHSGPADRPQQKVDLLSFSRILEETPGAVLRLEFLAAPAQQFRWRGDGTESPGKKNSTL